MRSKFVFFTVESFNVEEFSRRGKGVETLELKRVSIKGNFADLQD